MGRDIDEPVEIAAYDAEWPRWYGEDAAQLERTLGAEVSLEHFGSTSVKGLCGKPIIDVLVGLDVWPMLSKVREGLEQLGYEYFGEAGVPGREYFRRRAKHATNLAVVEKGGPLWRDNLAIRDYLRTHEAVAQRYAEAKRAAWSGGARMLLEYSRAKHELVDEILRQARERSERGWGC